MKFELEATPEELRTHGRRLLGELEKTLSPHHPELAQSLRKALVPPAPSLQLRDPTLRELHDRATARYQRGMTRAVLEIMEILGDGMQKSEAADTEQSSLIDELAGDK